ncbi:membrane bound O-acyl transferase family-domain-containing protein [Geopyxis carbonaria]|nr:membrane bound O-acyl transferase family-domain-containing protein [Geopyxis carbonaria]
MALLTGIDFSPSRPIISPIPVALDCALILTLLLLPPFRARITTALFAHTALSAHIAHFTTTSRATDFFLFLALLHIWLLLADFALAGAPEDDAELCPPARDAPARVKAAWLLGLLGNPRGIGMPWEFRGRVAWRGGSRREFVVRRLGYSAATVAALFTLQVFAPTKEALDAAGPLERVLRSYVCVAIVANVVNMAHMLTTALFVAVGTWQPAECPPLYGDVQEAYSIRRFWSVVWHQSLRRRSQVPARALVRALGLPPRHPAALGIRVVLAFLLAGVLHGLPLWMASGVEGGQMLYFLLQPVGIAVEAVVERVTRGWGLSETVRRNVGRVWVLVWFGCTNVIFVNGFFEAGLEPVWLHGKY